MSEDEHNAFNGAKMSNGPRKGPLATLKQAFGRTQNDDDELLEELSNDEFELVTTPMDTKKLSLNPGGEPAPKNPLCPVCEEQIVPISNDAERRFVCGCEQIWQFTFDRQFEDE